MRKLDKNTSTTGKTDRPRKGHDWRDARPVSAIVLCPVIKTASGRTPQRKGAPAAPRRPRGQDLQPEARLREAEGLAEAIDLRIAESGLVTINAPRPATLFGKGKVEELRGLVLAHEAEVVIVDHPLTPVQQRNLEKAWNTKVLDRTGLILEIFGRRARTREGRLQVELAHLTYQKSRLVRSWTHLERQRGGVGFMGGPGERQIESDRRMLQERINAIAREIETVKRTRKLHREGRSRVPYPVIALVGYTNAGKSTLFNALTDAQVVAQDMLFATLDPTMREVRLPGGSKVIFSDTVGFISNLPTDLVAAFRATLEEVIEADLILLVRDMADSNCAAQYADVISILADLGINANDGDDRRVIEVWNKLDLLAPENRAELARQAARREGRAICISAQTGEGVSELLSAIEERLNRSHVTLEVELSPMQGALANWLHENAQVLERRSTETGHSLFRVRLSQAKHAILMRRLASAGSARVKSPRPQHKTSAA
ncbi:MAG: GTPase HflX [Methyloligellaceae bacterium]